MTLIPLTDVVEFRLTVKIFWCILAIVFLSFWNRFTFCQEGGISMESISSHIPKRLLFSRVNKENWSSYFIKWGRAFYVYNIEPRAVNGCPWWRQMLKDSLLTYRRKIIQKLWKQGIALCDIFSSLLHERLAPASQKRRGKVKLGIKTLSHSSITWLEVINFASAIPFTFHCSSFLFSIWYFEENLISPPLLEKQGAQIWGK